MNSLSRRDLFRAVLGRRREESSAPETPISNNQAPDDATPAVALVLDPFCLAWQGSFCSVCVEHCPVPGAVRTENGRPRIDPDQCTGCRVCQDVCPAPKNAIFLVPRKPRPGMVARHHGNPPGST